MMTYEEYEKYLEATYSQKAIAEMWSDAMPENPAVALGNDMFILKDEYGINIVCTTLREFFDCIDSLYIRPFEQENGWMY